MKQNVSCKEVMHHICESLSEEIDSPRCKNIKKHLEECPDCTAYFESIETTINLYKNYNSPLPKNAHEKILKFLSLERK